MTAPAAPTSSLGQRATTDRAKKLWKADSRGYALAGRWHTARVFGTVAFALAAPVITFWWPSSTDLVAAAASIWLLLARAVLSPAEDWERRRAVNAQELFDIEVFELKWNSGLAGRRPAEENLAKAASKYRGDAPSDWYGDTEDLPRPLDVVLSQRSSAVWGRGTHLAYAIIVVTFGAAVFLVGLIIGGVAHLSLTDYLLRLFLPSVPALLDTIDLSRAHWSTSRQKGQIEIAADNLWATGIHDPRTITEADCRQLQDQTYRVRFNGPRVASWLYHLRRASDERAMRQAVADRVADYRAAQTP